MQYETGKREAAEAVSRFFVVQTDACRFLPRSEAYGRAGTLPRSEAYGRAGTLPHGEAFSRPGVLPRSLLNLLRSRFYMV